MEQKKLDHLLFGSLTRSAYVSRVTKAAAKPSAKRRPAKAKPKTKPKGLKSKAKKSPRPARNR